MVVKKNTHCLGVAAGYDSHFRTIYRGYDRAAPHITIVSFNTKSTHKPSSSSEVQSGSETIIFAAISPPNNAVHNPQVLLFLLDTGALPAPLLTLMSLGRILNFLTSQSSFEGLDKFIQLFFGGCQLIDSRNF